jgi:hypothetical protein
MRQFELAIDDAREETGKMIATALAPLLSNVKEVITWLNNTHPAISGVIGLVGTLTAVFITLRVAGILPTTAAIKAFFVSLGPIGWAITGISALATAFLLLRDNTDAATDAKLSYDNTFSENKDGKYFSSKAMMMNKKQLEESIKGAEYALSSGAFKEGETDVVRITQLYKEAKLELMAYKKVLKEGTFKKDLSSNKNSIPTEGNKNIETPLDAVKKEISFWEKTLEMSVGASEETKKRVRGQIDFYKSELERLTYEINGIPSVTETIFDYEDDLMARLNFEDVMLDNIDVTDQFIKSATFGLTNLQMVSESVKDGFDSATQGLASAGASAIKIFGNANSVLEQFIETMIRATAQSIIFKLVNSAVDLALPGVGTFFKSIFGMASGAVVTRPTLAVVGEGSEPEGVFPLSYLNNMMSTRPQVVYVQMEPVELKARGMDLRSVIKQTEHNVKKRR